MVNIPAGQSIFLAKAEESLAGADSELAAGRYNNCVNRCYYACFQAAIVALMRAGVTPPGADGEWGPAFVQREFAGRLIHRRKLFPSDLASVLSRLLGLRQTADYEGVSLGERQATRAVRNARQFVHAIRDRTGSTW
jgi:uncharacterized protein (UPF0332 family)